MSDGDAGVAHPADELDAHLGLGRRQARHHLVEEQELRLGRERARHFEAALLGRREVAAGAPARAGEACEVRSTS